MYHQFGLNISLKTEVFCSYASDLKSQAEELIRRMDESDEVDKKNDWKLVTVFIGYN